MAEIIQRIDKNESVEVPEMRGDAYGYRGASFRKLIVEWLRFLRLLFLLALFCTYLLPSGTTTSFLRNGRRLLPPVLMRPWPVVGCLTHCRSTRAQSLTLISVRMMCMGVAGDCLLTRLRITSGDSGAMALPQYYCKVISGLSRVRTSATYMSEVALEGRKGFFASFQYVTLTAPTTGALLVVVILQQVLEMLLPCLGMALCAGRRASGCGVKATSPAG